MQPYALFTGVLQLPDKVIPTGTSPVTLADQVVAHIRWRMLTSRARFEVLDPTGAWELASGRAEGITGQKYGLYGPAGERLLTYKLGWGGPSGRCKIILPSGVVLTTKGSWTDSRFTVLGPDRATVARIVTTTGWVTLRPDSYAFEVLAPVFSPVQAIGLAQCIRSAVQAQHD